MGRLVSLIALCTVAMACDVSKLNDAECPPAGTELTFDGFGKPFLDAHCQRCHASDSNSRNGAPDKYQFDTPGDVHTWSTRIFARAADSNTSMPPGRDGPSAEERALLAEWLACGAP